MVPEGEIRGGVLLLHGLTDSPYSVRAEAELYASEGFYALSLRVPGHGTIPGALTVARWEDWRAAARLGARHVRGRVPAPLPFHVVGYSNGGALAVQYALDTLGDPSLPRPDRVVVMSPMIGVTRFSGAAAAHREDGHRGRRGPLLRAVALDGRPARVQPVQVQLVPGLRRPADGRDHAGHPGLDRRARPRAGASGSCRRSSRSPRSWTRPCETWATVDALFGKLQDNGSELVLFDVNRSAVAMGFLKDNFDDRLAALLANPGRHYRLALVTNARAGAPEAVVEHPRAGLDRHRRDAARARLAAADLLAVPPRRALPAGRSRSSASRPT